MRDLRLRLPLLALAALALFAALWAALVRLGWSLPSLPLPIAGQHGALMTSGFLGTLIGLERAVALGWRHAYVPPLLAALGTLALSLGLPLALGRGLIALGALGLVLVFAGILRQQRASHTLVMSLGAALWLIGNVLWWLRWPIQTVAPWWAGFLILTIAGERLELGRILRLGRLTQAAFIASVGICLSGLVIILIWLELGWQVSGAGWMLLGGWLLANDIARRTVRKAGLTRYIAVCLLLGYGWLVLGGALWLGLGPRLNDRLVYDALLHSLLLGCVFSMIFGHAPIIVPSLLGPEVTYRAFFYAPLTLLHLALLVRVAGDLMQSTFLHMWGGLFNVIAILIFLPVMARSLWQPKPEPVRLSR